MLYGYKDKKEILIWAKIEESLKYFSTSFSKHTCQVHVSWRYGMSWVFLSTGQVALGLKSPNNI